MTDTLHNAFRIRLFKSELQYNRIGEERLSTRFFRFFIYFGLMAGIQFYVRDSHRKRL